MHMLREAPKTRPFLSDPIQDALIMVQRLPEGRKKTKRVESQAVEDVCLIARNAIDRIGDLEQKLRKTRLHLNAHINLVAALMEPKPWVGLTDDEMETLY